MSYSPFQVVSALRDLTDGKLSITRWTSDASGDRDRTVEALFRELLVEDVESYGRAELGAALIEDLKASGCLP